MIPRLQFFSSQYPRRILIVFSSWLRISHTTSLCRFVKWPPHNRRNQYRDGRRHGQYGRVCLYLERKQKQKEKRQNQTKRNPTRLGLEHESYTGSHRIGRDHRTSNVDKTDRYINSLTSARVFPFLPWMRMNGQRDTRPKIQSISLSQYKIRIISSSKLLRLRNNVLGFQTHYPVGVRVTRYTCWNRVLRDPVYREFGLSGEFRNIKSTRN